MYVVLYSGIGSYTERETSPGIKKEREEKERRWRRRGKRKRGYKEQKNERN